MFNNVVLDVFIGIVLVYLLYSLFVSIVGEMIATWMALRSRVLRVAIEKMLSDGMFTEKAPKKIFRLRIWNIIQRYFLKEFDSFKHSFAGKFYANPSIKYLSDNGGEHKTSFSQTKPSYISADMFAETLIQLLKNKGVGSTDIEKINFCLQFNTHHIDPAALKNLLDHAGNAGNDINILKERFKGWFNETMDRATGWYKRRLQLILFWLGLIVALAFNVDSIKIIKLLTKDKEARNQLANMAVAIAKDTAKYKDFLTANGDTLHTKAVLDSGLAHVTKDVSDANFALGLGWPLSDLQTCDTRSFDQKEDSKSFEVLKLYQNSLNEFGNASGTLQSRLRTEKQQTELLRQQFGIYRFNRDINTLKYEQLFLMDTIKGIDKNVIKKQLSDTIQQMKDSLNSIVLQLSIAETFYKSDSTLLAMLVQGRNEAIKQINTITSNHFVIIDTIVSGGKSNEKLIVYTKTPYSTLRKICHVLWHYCNPFHSDFWGLLFSLQFLGFIVTALMISLGAPFWFDLLKKLVAIRGAGVKPEEKKEEKATNKPASDQPINKDIVNHPALPTNDPVEDVYEEALKKYGPAIRKVPGVKSVFSVVKNKIKQVQVNVDTDLTKNEVLTQFPKIVIGTTDVPMFVAASGVPVSHAGLQGTIANKSGKNGFGSLGCILQMEETGTRHILSCWHVLKGDLRYSDTDTERTIIDRESANELADRWAGGIRGQFDYGLAVNRSNTIYPDNSFLKTKLNIPQSEKLKYRFVPKADIDKQVSIKYYDGLNDRVVNGLIYTNTPSVDINYVDKTRTVKDILILTNENEISISEEGNSGSIVFDENHIAIAMIIGGDRNYSYAIRLSNIFNLHTEMTIA